MHLHLGDNDDDGDDNEPLEDTTAALALHSKRTERLQRKQATRARKKTEQASLIHLPTELILAILELTCPSDVFSFSLGNRRFQALVAANSSALGDAIIHHRYRILARCFPLPTVLSAVPPAIQPLLTDPQRQKQLSIHNKPYQHVQPPDPQLICTCLTCILTWNNLSLALDFAHWQDSLDTGEPIPVLPRGQSLRWNEKFVERNARIVRRALDSSLWHAWILEMHLDSTVRSIKRHQNNKGNKRRHVDMTDEEAKMGTDAFLEKAGPLSLEFPFSRDEYYMLEAYLPNRWWKKVNGSKWIYTIEGQHERDLELVVRFAKR